MSLKEDMKAYRERLANVEAVVAQERRSASMELRWQQLNSVFGMGKALGLLHKDPSEMGVIERWAKLKEKHTNLPPKV